jgi:hypothetical protein
MATSFKIDIVAGRTVSWYATAQSSIPKTLEIKDPTGKMIVNTTVFSTDLSNFSVGSFIARMTGEYLVSFPGTRDVRDDTATITNNRGDTVAQTYQFAGEDSIDGDYNDIFTTITWYRARG